MTTPPFLPERWDVIFSWSMLSRLLPLPLPGAQRSQTPQHYALLPPSARTPAFPRHVHQRIIGLTWTQSPVYYLTHIFVSSPGLFPAAALIVVCLCVSVSWCCFCLVLCLFLIKCQLPVPASCLRRRSLQFCLYNCFMHVCALLLSPFPFACGLQCTTHQCKQNIITSNCYTQPTSLSQY